MVTPRKLPETLNPEEQQSLLNQPNTRYPTGLRNLCMLRLMLNAGLRVGEVVAIKPHHLNPLSGKLMIREGKGSKDRTLWLNENDLEWIRKWKETRTELPECPWLFPTLKGTQVKTRYMRALVTRLTSRAGIPKNISPHSLRHTFATDLYKETKNIRMVQKALGHSDLSTTMIYTHLIDDELESAMKKLRE